jgi:hypothetical protein
MERPTAWHPRARAPLRRGWHARQGSHRTAHPRRAVLRHRCATQQRRQHWADRSVCRAAVRGCALQRESKPLTSRPSGSRRTTDGGAKPPDRILCAAPSGSGLRATAAQRRHRHLPKGPTPTVTVGIVKRSMAIVLNTRFRASERMVSAEDAFRVHRPPERRGSAPVDRICALCGARSGAVRDGAAWTHLPPFVPPHE